MGRARAVYKKVKAENKADLTNYSSCQRRLHIFFCKLNNALVVGLPNNSDCFLNSEC